MHSVKFENPDALSVVGEPRCTICNWRIQMHYLWLENLDALSVVSATLFAYFFMNENMNHPQIQCCVLRTAMNVLQNMHMYSTGLVEIVFSGFVQSDKEKR